MDSEKTNRPTGESPKARKTTQSRRTKSSPANPVTPDAPAETIAIAVASPVDPTTNPVVEVKSQAPAEPLPPLEIPTRDSSVTEIPDVDVPEAESPAAEPASDSVEIHEGEVMATDNSKPTASLTPAKEGQLVAQPSGGHVDPYKVVSLMTIAGGQRPVMASTLEIKGMLTSNRPIFASDLVVYETINVSGIRPVMASPFEIVGSLDAAGHRPIAANEFEVAATINVSGIRPIAASTLIVNEMLTATRPIASNDIDDSGTLMGFLD